MVTGINAIVYYADQIFGAAAFATEASRTTVTTWAIGGVNVVATLIAIAFVDRLGRRKLLLTGLIGMSASLNVVGGAFRFIDAVALPSRASISSGPTVAGMAMLLGLVARDFFGRDGLRQLFPQSAFQGVIPDRPVVAIGNKFAIV